MDYKILALTTKAVFKNETLEEEKTLGYVHLANVQAMKRDGIIAEKVHRGDDIITSKRTDIDECWLFKSVKLHRIAVAQIAIVDNYRPFRELDYELLNRFAQIVAIEMEKNDFYKDNCGVMYSYFLSDLLSGKMKNNRTIVQRLNILGWKTYQWFKIAVITDSRDEIYQEKQEYIVQHLRQIMSDCRWTIYKKKIVVFMSRPNKKIFNEKEKENFDSFLKSNHLVMGISHSFTTLQEAELYYKQAFRAVSVGDPVSAAEALNIHRNTLLYRINKIKELTDLNLENGDERFLIQLYFKLVEYQRGSWIN